MVSFYLDINVVVVWVNRPPSLESFHVSGSFPSFQRSLKNKYQNSSVSHLQIFERQQKSAKSHLFAWQYQTFESPKITTSNYPFFSMFMLSIQIDTKRQQHQNVLLCKSNGVIPITCWASKLILFGENSEKSLRFVQNAILPFFLPSSSW